MLLHNLEKMLFNVSDDVILHHAKRELFLQIIRYDIGINIQGFFSINKQFMLAVVTN